MCVFFLGCSVNCCNWLGWVDLDKNLPKMPTQPRDTMSTYVEQVAVHELIQWGDGNAANQLRSIETSCDIDPP